jgi:hypothetical protein
VSEPVLAGDNGVSNVYEEHVYKLRVAVGAAGAITYRSMGATIVHSGTGEYTITLPKAYEELIDFHVGFLDAAGSLLFAVLRTNNVATDGTLVFQMCTETGTPTDPDSGAYLYVTVGASSNVLNQKFAG